jgi:MFS family permease
MFTNRWWVVFTSTTAGIVGAGLIMVFATGVFIKPVSQALHFGRGDFSTALGVANVMTAFATLAAGRLIDRYGMRVIMLPLIALFALATASLSLMTSSLALVITLFAIQGVFASVQTPVGYSKMIAARFDDRRGLALGIALTGVGLGTIIIPQYSRYLLAHYGWRYGYIGLGVAIFVLAFIPVAIFFKEPDVIKRDRELRRLRGVSDNPDLPGVSFAEALHNFKFWAMTLAIFLLMSVTNGVLVNMVPMLTDRGVPIGSAVGAMSISGLALIGGRLLTGYLLDKIFAIYIAIFFVLLPMLGAGILASGATGSWPLVAAVIMGLSLGAEFDMMPFIVSRYFGVRAFGSLAGFLFMAASLANAAGMLLMGWCFQLTHSYTTMLYAFEAMLVVALLLFSTLGPYRYPAPKRKAAREMATAVSD